jgi:hypothetical protein
LRLPSDLTGITPGEYEASRSDKNWYAAVGPACGRIRRQMESLKSFQDMVDDLSIQAAVSDPTPPVPDLKKVDLKSKKTSRSTTKDLNSIDEIYGDGVKASKYKNSYLISGETKPCKEVLKSVNGRWIGGLGGWTISPTRLEELKSRLPKMQVED